MAEKNKNLCAQIPEELHAKVRQRQEESGLALGPFMTQLIESFFEMEGKPMVKDDHRTIAFSVDPETFDRFKEFLKAHGLKQNAFLRDFILRTLEADSQPQAQEEN